MATTPVCKKRFALSKPFLTALFKGREDIQDFLVRSTEYDLDTLAWFFFHLCRGNIPIYSQTYQAHQEEIDELLDFFGSLKKTRSFIKKDKDMKVRVFILYKDLFQSLLTPLFVKA